MCLNVEINLLCLAFSGALKPPKSNQGTKIISILIQYSNTKLEFSICNLVLKNLWKKSNLYWWSNMISKIGKKSNSKAFSRKLDYPHLTPKIYVMMLRLHIVHSIETDAWKNDRRNDACSWGEVGVCGSRLILLLVNFWNIRTTIIYQRDKISRDFQPSTPLEDWSVRMGHGWEKKSMLLWKSQVFKNPD